MSDTTTVSPLRQRMIEDMAARKLNPHTQQCCHSSRRKNSHRNHKEELLPPSWWAIAC